MRPWMLTAEGLYTHARKQQGNIHADSVDQQTKVVGVHKAPSAKRLCPVAL